MAIEDAVSLAVVLPLGTVAGEIPARLDIYEQARKPRAEQVVEYTRLNGRDENDVAGPRLTGKSSSSVYPRRATVIARRQKEPELTLIPFLSGQLKEWSSLCSSFSYTTRLRLLERHYKPHQTSEWLHERESVGLKISGMIYL